MYGPHTTVYNRFNRVVASGASGNHLFAALTSELAGTPDEISIDTTHVGSASLTPAAVFKGERLLLRRLAAPKCGQ